MRFILLSDYVTLCEWCHVDAVYAAQIQMKLKNKTGYHLSSHLGIPHDMSGVGGLSARIPTLECVTPQIGVWQHYHHATE